MNDADERIERLMAGLRDAEPSPGMKRRILEAMEAHQARPSPWLSCPPVVASLACAATLAASLIVVSKVNQPSHPPANVRQRAQPVAVAHKDSIGPRRSAPRVAARRPRDLTALRDVPSAGFPAPPLPLTEQERMLLRVARRDDAKNKALLNPDLQAAQSAKNTEQFQRFFEIDAKEMRSESE
jgi:hypothetical protein